jgi:Ca2+-transporting ATPase
LARIVLRQVTDVTVLALLAAAAISLVLSLLQAGGTLLETYGDTGAIMGIVILNAILGTIQQRRADRALAALRDLTAPTAAVVREGEERQVPSGEVVPGDIIVLEAGDRVPADARVVEAHDLEASEAALTGESRPGPKDPNHVLDPAAHIADRTNMVYAGTAIVAGKGRALVVATGSESEVGRIAAMVAQTKESKTPLEQDLHRFGLYVVAGCVTCSALVFMISAAHGGQSIKQMFMVAVALAVAAIPEGLPAITTIVLAFGARSMARKGALVRRLHAVETLGCAQVLCADKTGTLTENRMEVTRLAAGGKYWGAGDTGEPPWEIMEAAKVAGGARGKDPTDLALLGVAKTLQLPIASEPVVAEVAFSSGRRLSSTVFNDHQTHTVTTRGACERLLEISTHVLEGQGKEEQISDNDKLGIAHVAEEWAASGIRVIGLAQRRTDQTDDARWEENMTFVGLAGISDPLRPEVKTAVAKAQRAGIRIMMITGDHPSTARAVAAEAGILTSESEVVSGQDLQGVNDTDLAERLPRIAVVARATASDKMRIVNGLQRRGEIAAMTGDGVNDAPALKAADIGVAMGKGGTDVAREASDMVLADDNFATIVEAVSQGRSIYANIRRFIVFLFASNAGLVAAVTVAALLGWDTPLAPIQILWINLITNGLPALALGLEPSLEDRMLLPPRNTKEPIVRWRDMVRISLVGVVMGMGGLWVFYEASGRLPTSGSASARTAAFCVFALAPLVYAFAARSERKPLYKIGFLSNRLLLGAVSVGIVLQVVAVLLPAARPLFRTGTLQGSDWLRVLAAACAPFLVVEIWKMVTQRAESPQSTAVPVEGPSPQPTPT